MSVTLQALVWTLSQPAHSAQLTEKAVFFSLPDHGAFEWLPCTHLFSLLTGVWSSSGSISHVIIYLFLIVLMVVYGWNVINIMNLKIQTQTWTSENMSCQPGVSSCLSQNGVLAGRLKMLKTFHQYFIHDQQQQLDLLQDVEIPAGSGFSRERDHGSTDWGNSERKIFWWAF